MFGNFVTSRAWLGQARRSTEARRSLLSGDIMAVGVQHVVVAVPPDKEVTPVVSSEYIGACVAYERVVPSVAGERIVATAANERIPVTSTNALITAYEFDVTQKS